MLNVRYFMVTLVKSSASCNYLHKEILKKLKLKKIGKVIFVPLTDYCIYGMLKKVSYLIKCNRIII